MTAVLFILATGLILTGCGWTVVTKLDQGAVLNDLERLAFGLIVAALGLHLVVFAVGHWRLDRLGMGLVAGVFILGAIPGLRSMPWGTWRGNVARFLGEATHRRFEVLLWILILAIALSALLQGMAPPNDYDSLMYHLSIPLYDVAVGRMEIAWGWHNRNFFPILVENLARFALVFSGTGAAQMMHGLTGLSAAMISSALAKRMGGSRITALLAALMFLSIRVIVWEMATLEVEVAQAAYCGGALLAYMLLRRQGGYGLACLFGLMLAGAFHVKYPSMLYAGTFAPIMFWDLVRRRIKIGPWLTGPLVTLVVFAPHMARNVVFTGNPVFPLLNPLFNKGGPSFMEDISAQYGVGRDLLSHLIAPWAFSVDPLRHFDGVILGAPYLLALVPFAFLGRRRAIDIAPAIVVGLGFYICWFHLISQQVRFLAPLFPLLAALAAHGAVSLWYEAGASRPVRLGVATLFLILAATQSMFVGIYTVLRLPVALGLQSVESYLTKTPTMDGSHYLTCKYLSEKLQPGQRYLSLLQPHFATCPPISAVIWLPGEEKAWMTGQLPTYSAQETLAKLDEADIRYIIVQSRFENRRNADAHAEMRTTELGNNRIAQHIVPAFETVKPLFSDKFADVYDGVEIREVLRHRLRAEN